MFIKNRPDTPLIMPVSPSLGKLFFRISGNSVFENNFYAAQNILPSISSKLQ